jgi:hypothetical protein
MSHHDRALVVGALVVVVLAGIGAAVHVVPWLRDNRTDISLILLMLLLTASGFTAALALIIPYADRPTPAEELDGADHNADDNADADTDLVCPQCGGAHCQTLKPITADGERLCDGCPAQTALFTLARGKEPSP